MTNVISIRNLTKSYGKKRGVTDVSFDVKEGEIFGFLGPNGAGKSTTIRSMLGFLKFQEGSIEILGMDSIKDHEKILQNVGYMPSEALFYPSMTVAETIKYAADVRKMDCSEEAKKLCRRLKVDTTKKIKELSLGNRKKVSIICAMQHRPKLFIFDEPTSGLDPLMQNTFFELIEEYVDQGTTCMLSTHVLTEVSRYCDRAAIMREGHLIKVDTVDKLMETSVKNVKITADGKHDEYLFKGDINELIASLQGKKLENLSIEDPSLEDMFMHFYEEKEEK
jgi:ABC-2 type transport system ATP-binding protein